ncbi:MAG: sensor histidine kinase [Lachnospiraceae bacterium]|nr:hypothetical protein C819_04272 [Lachnospiraceae bacterium 10-1]MCX4351557.1 sensor histidine kinase [Lachnospiraceae bacterium]
MNDNKTNVLKEIYEGLLEIQNEENIIIQDNLNRIREIEIYLDSVKDEPDLLVFSPRSTENLLFDKIKDLNKEKDELENNNRIHYQKYNKYGAYIKQLEQLIISVSLYKYDDRKILEMQEKDRQRIARELHDSSVQNLTHLIHMIELSIMYIDKDSIRAKLELENCIKILKSTVEEIREVIFNFRPMSFDDLGFKQCIENFISDSKIKYKKCEIEYQILNLTDIEWKNINKQEINLFLLSVYRIIQEAINNALKHSGADKIILIVGTKNDKCYININDNGKGFNFENKSEQEDKHFGLSIMKERINLLHGVISINTDIEKGTEINIEIPLI